MTDRLEKKYINMEYCLTADRYGDFYTNTTQGGLYKTQRQAIINPQYNDPNDYAPEEYIPSVSQEYVGNDISNRNGIASVQAGEIKCVRSSSNILN